MASNVVLLGQMFRKGLSRSTHCRETNLEYDDKQLIIRIRLILTSSMSLQGLQIPTYFVPRISNPWLKSFARRPNEIP